MISDMLRRSVGWKAVVGSNEGMRKEWLSEYLYPPTLAYYTLQLSLLSYPNLNVTLMIDGT